MKTAILRAVGCFSGLMMAVGSLHGMFIPLSVDANLTVAGSIVIPASFGGQTDAYTTTQTRGGVAGFDDTLTGNASAQTSIPQPPNWPNTYSLHVDSTASHQLTLASNSMSMAMSATTGNSGAVFQIGHMISSADSYMAITFKITEPVTFSFDASGWYWAGDYPYGGAISDGFVMSLVSTSGIPYFSYVSDGHPGWHIPSSTTGTLDVGDYTFTARVKAMGPWCPLSHNTSGSGSATLTFASVPDSASTFPLVCFAFGCAAVVGIIGHGRRTLQPD